MNLKPLFSYDGFTFIVCWIFLISAFLYEMPVMNYFLWLSGIWVTGYAFINCFLGMINAREDK